MISNLFEYPTITQEQLNRWYKFKKNVLIYGEFGVGKTSIIKSFWESLGIKYAMFSGATLDPWVDIIGIPKLVTRNREKVLEFARPQNMDENLEAIFIDEYNRTHPQVRNALLELQQFKTINGRKFPKLKVIWAAANPKDTDNNYDVDELDPAQEDRFQIIVKLANKVNIDYFTKKYNPTIAKTAFDWFENLDPTFKSFVSPRRVDYAIETYLEGGDVREVIPNTDVNIVSLIKGLKGNDALDKFFIAVNNGDEGEIKKFLSNQKTYQEILKGCLSDVNCCEAIIKYADPEQVFALAESNPKIGMLVHKSVANNPKILEALEDTQKASGSYPDWYATSQDRIYYVRASQGDFEAKTSNLSYSGVEAKITDIGAMLNVKPASEIIDDINIPKGFVTLVKLSEESAENFLKFASKYCQGSIKTVDQDDDPAHNFSNKFKTLYYSSLNVFFLRDANLFAAEYLVPDVLKLLVGSQPPKANGGKKRNMVHEISL